MYPIFWYDFLLSNESRSALQDSYTKDFIHLARRLLNAAPADFRPYNALTTSVVHTFSATGACTKAFKIMPNFKIIEGGNYQGYSSVSLNTMLAYVIVVSASVMWLPATSLALCLKSSILISKIIWHHTNWWSKGTDYPSGRTQMPL